MGFARFVLIFTGISFAGYGLWCALDPASAVTPFTGLGLDQPAEQVEAMAMYGGLQTGVGLFLLAAGARREWFTPGLLMVVLMMGGLGLLRMVGMSMQGPVGFHPWAAVYEVTTTVFALAALYRMRGRGPVGALA